MSDVFGKYELKRTIFDFRPDGIVHVRFRDWETITLDDYFEGIELMQSLGKTDKYLFLYESGENSLVSDDLRRAAASSENNQYTIADAYVVRSLAQKIIGNFYVRFNKPVRPTRMFNTLEDAIAWLKELQAREL